LRATSAAFLAAGLACTSAPATDRTTTIAPGVRVHGVALGGLTVQPALAKLTRSVTRPIRIVYRGHTLVVPAAQLGARGAVETALRRALHAGPGTRIVLPISYSHEAVATYVKGLDRRFGRPATPARLIGATRRGPLISAGAIGLAVERETMVAAIEQELATTSRGPLVLMMSAVRSPLTRADFGPLIIVERRRNRLRLYQGTRLVRAFAVSTGRTIYPTPHGRFSISDKQRNPWWHPPTSAWAKGLRPVPPGPGNPLGTRWMGLDAPGVGIHGTPEDASIGYSESHGCIRMHIPDAEWLFRRVPVGTPVVIL